jgi:hypothetical protein
MKLSNKLHTIKVLILYKKKIVLMFYFNLSVSGKIFFNKHNIVIRIDSIVVCNFSTKLTEQIFFVRESKIYFH